MSKKFYTDGIKTIKRDIDAGDVIPEGFHLGRTFNHNSWIKGLTKDDPRVSALAQKMRATRIANGSFVSWNKGLTKETNQSLKQVSEKVSIARRGKPSWNKGIPATEEQKKKQSLSMKGHIPYNKGLTKDTCPSLMSASQKLMGHKSFVTNWEEAKKREYETKKRNGSFNTSKKEAEMFETLCEKYGKDNVITQYKDERYPFNCDFYVVDKDLFIEYNGTIEHNGKPFDPNSIEDLRELESLHNLAVEKGPRSRYWNIIKWWTQIDPLKLETMRKNQLNFLVIYPKVTICK